MKVLSIIGILLTVLLPGCQRVPLQLNFAAPHFACLQSQPARCYSPTQYRALYDVQSLINHGITGRGITIVIPVAESSQVRTSFTGTLIRDSLQEYDRAFHLPSVAPSIVAPYGGTPTLLSALEAILDLEVAHAIAPGARLLLLVPRPHSTHLPKSQQGQVETEALVEALQYALIHALGDIVSMSLSVEEDCPSASVKRALHVVLTAARKQNVTVVASSGDGGVAGKRCSDSSSVGNREVEAPASDPLVTAVGGTMFAPHANHEGRPEEIAWNEPQPPPHRQTGYAYPLNAASTGGWSNTFARPSYQTRSGGNTAFRGVPDVSFDAGANGNLILLFAYKGRTKTAQAGGTSASAPAWAGIIALADQYWHRRLGFLNRTLYCLGNSPLYHAAFHDIVRGQNSTKLMTAKGKIVKVRGYTAHASWDPVTGWGSPKVTTLVHLLAKSCRSSNRQERKQGARINRSKVEMHPA